MAYLFDLAVLCLGGRRMKRVRRKRRRRRDICKSHEPSMEILNELLIEIFMRLPVKSLMRLKSVSKLWSSLICSQYFTDCFLKVSSSPLRIYMNMWSGFGNKKVLLSASSSPHDSDLSSFEVDQYWTIPVMEGYSVSHLYRGLICFVNGLSAKIYNISTRQLVVLPDIEVIAEDLKRKRIMYSIGHDPVHNQYKVVCTVSGPYVMTEIWVLQLGGDCSSRWRKITSPFQPHYRLTQGSTINGRIYYLAFVCMFPYVLVLVSFDIHYEEINIHQEPDSLAKTKENRPYHLAFCHCSNDLIEYRGRVALLDHRVFGYKGKTKLWVMKDAEKNSWSKKTLVLHPSQQNMIQGIDLRVHGTTRNGEVIFVPTIGTITIGSHKRNVFLYNLRNNLLRKVTFKETLKRHHTKYWDLIGFDDVENLTYL